MPETAVPAVDFSADADLISFLKAIPDGRYRSRTDSKCQLGFSRGCRVAIARSAVMSCITACRPSRIESNPARRSRFRAAVRSVASTPAPLPRQRCLSSWSCVSRIQCQLS